MKDIQTVACFNTCSLVLPVFYQSTVKYITVQISNAIVLELGKINTLKGNQNNFKIFH